jgi:hypothetical protein
LYRVRHLPLQLCQNDLTSNFTITRLW